jgi:DNA-directed RNA polymerase subunit RPC12/RpoP
METGRRRRWPPCKSNARADWVRRSGRLLLLWTTGCFCRHICLPVAGDYEQKQSPITASLMMKAEKQSMSRLNEKHLNEVARCPYCQIANPTLESVWQSGKPLPRATDGPLHAWGAYRCTSCGDVVLAKEQGNAPVSNPAVVEIIPTPKAAPEDIPEPARVFLQQAYETLHAPDAAAVMAGSAVDAMLKTLVPRFNHIEG